MKSPNTYFCTRLPGSAKETELRIRNIVQWKKKRPPAALFLLMLVLLFSCFGLVSCERAAEEPPAAEQKEETMEPSAEEPGPGEIILHTGTVTVARSGKPTRMDYEVQLLRGVEESGGHQLNLTVRNRASGQSVQRISYDVPAQYIERTLGYGLETGDFNGDGSEDILLDVGTALSGKSFSALCFLYQPDQEQYALLNGFEQLDSPRYIAEQNAFRVSSAPMEAPYGCERYEIIGNDLVKTAVLTWYDSERYGGVYTEQRRVGDTMALTGESLLSNELDLPFWGMEGEVEVFEEKPFVYENEEFGFILRFPESWATHGVLSVCAEQDHEYGRHIEFGCSAPGLDWVTYYDDPTPYLAIGAIQIEPEELPEGHRMRLLGHRDGCWVYLGAYQSDLPSLSISAQKAADCYMTMYRDFSAMSEDNISFS